MSPYDYPYIKKTDEFVIGIFGGSVAEQLALYMNDAAQSKFQKELQKKIPQLAKKNIIILNMAVGGFQQPQPFIIFSYFIEMFDLVIQLDGWNDASINSSMAFPANFPMLSKVLYSDDLFLKEKVKFYTELKSIIRPLTQKVIQSKVLSSSPTISFVIQALNSGITIASREIVENVQSNPYKFQNISLYSSSEVSRSKNWEKYITMEHTLAASRNLPAYFFVQPSQYVPDSKPFTEKEKRIAFNTFNPREILPAFELIRKSAAGLQKQNLPIVDLNGIFSTERGDIFTDDCCHLNLNGNQMVAERIAQEIAKKWKK